MDEIARRTNTGRRARNGGRQLLRALICSASEADAQALISKLSASHQAVETRRFEDAVGLRAALSEPWDIVLAGWSTPLLSATAALEVIRELQPELPLFVVSHGSEEQVVEAMRAGARDWISPGALHRLCPAIQDELEKADQRQPGSRPHRRLEEELRASESRYRLLFEHSPIPKWVFDLESLRFLEVNEAAVRTYGYSREEFLGMTLRDIRRAEDVEPMLKSVPRDEMGPASFGTWKHRRKDGALLDVEVTAHSLVLGGRPVRMVAAHDVTEQRRLAARLLQSQKMDAIGRLAGGVAHDFNNILVVILAQAYEAMEQLGKEHPVYEEILQIDAAARRASALTRQLLDFSRQSVQNPQVIDLGALIANLDKMIGRLIGVNIEIETIQGQGLDKVRADPAQIEQVVVNLVVNARDAMPKGGKLTIEARNADVDDELARRTDLKPGRYVMLAVSDTGVGMDAATQARLFEPFFTTKDVGKGTGLGLSTVFGIIKQSGAAISVYSEPGRGSTFRIHFPATAATAEAAPQPAEAVSSSGTETILLVEDDPQVRMVVKRLLAAGGYAVVEARSGPAALELVASGGQEIQLVLSDLVMPGMDGRTLAAQLAARQPGLRVLFMSGYTEHAALNGAHIARDAAFIQKPFTAQELSRAVRHALDRGR